MSNSVVLELQEVHKLYEGTTPVLNGVNLQISPGELIGILGVSGAGKSTLLNILGLLDVPSQGQVRIMGKDCLDLSANASADIRNKYLGFVFQFFCLLPEFSLWENILIPSQLAGSKQGNISKARILVEELGISHVVHRRPERVSGGEKQRAALARALINNPQILLADEPTGNLDEKNSAQIFGLIKEVVLRDNISAVVVTHDVDLAAEHCTRILYLEEGTLSHQP